MPPRAWLLPVVHAVVAPANYDLDLLSCREKCEMLTDCDVRTWAETVDIRRCQGECPYDPEENMIAFTREDCRTISKRLGLDIPRGSGEDGCEGGCPVQPFDHVYTNDLRAMHASGELNNVFTDAHYHDRDKTIRTCFKGMDCYDEPDLNFIVDQEFQETQVKIGQGVDFRKQRETRDDRVLDVVTPLLEEIEVTTERDLLLEREDEIKEMHAESERRNEEREHLEKLQAEDDEEDNRERARVQAIAERQRAEEEAALLRKAREQALLDAVFQPGDREARLLAKAAERAAEAAERVIDGLEDVAEATQARADAIALGESIDDALKTIVDEIIPPLTPIDIVDDLSEELRNATVDSAPIAAILREFIEELDGISAPVAAGDLDTPDTPAAPGGKKPPPPRAPPGGKKPPPRKKGKAPPRDTPGGKKPPPPRRKGKAPPPRRARHDDPTVRKLSAAIKPGRRPTRLLDREKPVENATEALEQKLSQPIPKEIVKHPDEASVPVDPAPERARPVR